MEIYLVGGAVRDELLERPVLERDWVVVGSTPEEMADLGYRQVGRDFPVFLHPDTKEEYALARIERKTGPGHTGFVCHAGPEVTLEEDLRRRDLTVNAMARDAHGELVDPFGGCDDLRARILRHVSDSFVEDPLRVFRVARFAAQLPGFTIAAETQALIVRMARENQLAELSAERVWQELQKALAQTAPLRFFEVLREAAAMAPWLVEMEPLQLRLPPELTQAELRFAAVAWQMNRAAVTALCERLRAPKRYAQLAGQVAEHGHRLAAWQDQEPGTLLTALTGVGALAAQRDPEPALTVVEACSGCDLSRLRDLIRQLSLITAAQFQKQGVEGRDLGEAIQHARLQLINAASRWQPSPEGDS
jgi:tRNA nucleotidyltransferase (CCA-adding enzyme)